MASSVSKNKNGVPPEHYVASNYIVVIGDEGIGKTSLIKYFVNDEDSQPYALIIFSMYMFTYIKPHEVPNFGAFADLPRGYAAEDRATSYPLADVVLVCFAIDDPSSLERVSTTWVPEIRSSQVHDPPILLIGLKKDLRYDASLIQRLQDEGRSLVTVDQAKSVVDTLDLATYFECSTRTGEGAHLIFDDILKRLD